MGGRLAGNRAANELGRQVTIKENPQLLASLHPCPKGAASGLCKLWGFYYLCPDVLSGGVHLWEKEAATLVPARQMGVEKRDPRLEAIQVPEPYGGVSQISFSGAYPAGCGG